MSGAVSASQRNGLILFAHGARDPVWATPIEETAALIQARDPSILVSLAFLEFLQPSLEGAVQALVGQGAERLLIVPMFMAAGGHLIRDLPNLVAALQTPYPHIQFEILPPVGSLPSVQAAMAEAALQAVTPTERAD